MTPESLLERLWERHKNPLSWLVRPPLGALWFYGAWRQSGTLLALGVLGVATSWFWFPRPATPRTWVERFIDIERRYMAPPWTALKLAGLAMTAMILVVSTVAFWRHDGILGLTIVAFGALLKAVWSLKVARAAGIPAALIGIFVATVAAELLYWALSR